MLMYFVLVLVVLVLDIILFRGNMKREMVEVEVDLDGRMIFK